MKLRQLIDSSYYDEKITEIEIDSRKVKAGCLFVAIRGTTFDSHKVLAEVCSKNPAALVVEDASNIPKSFKGPVIKVKNTRLALDDIAAKFYRNPGAELFCVGVTGTNGKTTVTHMIETMLNGLGEKTAVIGTIDHHLGRKVWPTELTTPNAIDLQKRLREFCELSATSVAMETSSHALDQSRVDSVAWDAAVFTNLTRDHLDYHQTEANYFKAKQKLFTLLERSLKKNKFAVVNADDLYGRTLMTNLQVPFFSYGASGETYKNKIEFSVQSADFSGSQVQIKFDGTSEDLKLTVPGLHNVYNAAAAIGVALGKKYSLKNAVAALGKFKGVRGRLEPVPNKKGFQVFVDYAHTDDALSNVLTSILDIRRKSKLDCKIITVFGCGGNRDKGKRPLMGKSAVANSDVVVVTSDNPRTEDPNLIISDILSGIDPKLLNKKVFVNPDRREAIRLAAEMAREGDVVLIAGKGHEDYQILGTVRVPYSDVATVKEVLG